MGEISGLYEDRFKTPAGPCWTVAAPIGARPTVTSTVQELAMKRSYYYTGGLAALMFVVLVQSNGIIKTSAAGMPSQSVAAHPLTAPVPDAVSGALDELASWPIAATRK
jgi:hypothetical protein